MINALIQLLEEKHGKLDVENDVYFLFLKGGLFSIWFDEDEKEVKISVEMLPNDHTFVYSSDMDITEIGWNE